MIDYGMVSLLLIQLAACAGCIVAWLRLRKEADGIKASTSITDFNLSELQKQTVDSMTSVRTYEHRLASLEADIVKAVRSAQDARDQTADYKGEIRSLKASIAANRRWNREEEDGAATDTPPLDTPLPQPQAEPRNSSFGKLMTK